MKCENVEVNSKRWFNLTSLLNEEFKDINGYEGLYQVSNYGRIKSIRNNIILKTVPNTYGYPTVVLSNAKKKKTLTIHIAVAKAFIQNWEMKPTVNHKDGNKNNNIVENLEWATYSDQLKHSYTNHLREKPFGKLNTMYGKYGKDNPRSKPILQYDLDGNFIKEWENAYEIRRKLGYWQNAIYQCCLGRRKAAYKYIWKYKKDRERIDKDVERI